MEAGRFALVKDAAENCKLQWTPVLTLQNAGGNLPKAAAVSEGYESNLLCSARLQCQPISLALFKLQQLQNNERMTCENAHEFRGHRVGEELEPGPLERASRSGSFGVGEHPRTVRLLHAI